MMKNAEFCITLLFFGWTWQGLSLKAMKPAPQSGNTSRKLLQPISSASNDYEFGFGSGTTFAPTPSDTGLVSNDTNTTNSTTENGLLEGTPTLSATRSPAQVPSSSSFQHPEMEATTPQTPMPTFLPTKALLLAVSAKEKTDVPTLLETGIDVQYSLSPAPTFNPTATPTFVPTNSPTLLETGSTVEYSISPLPTHYPTSSPSNQPTTFPSKQPTTFPSKQPTTSPSIHPTNTVVEPVQEELPSASPSARPSLPPSISSYGNPFVIPSVSPLTEMPLVVPSLTPSNSPSDAPSAQPVIIGIPENLSQQPAGSHIPVETPYPTKLLVAPPSKTPTPPSFTPANVAPQPSLRPTFRTTVETPYPTKVFVAAPSKTPIPPSFPAENVAPQPSLRPTFRPSARPITGAPTPLQVSIAMKSHASMSTAPAPVKARSTKAPAKARSTKAPAKARSTKAPSKCYKQPGKYDDCNDYNNNKVQAAEEEQHPMACKKPSSKSRREGCEKHGPMPGSHNNGDCTSSSANSDDCGNGTSSAVQAEETPNGNNSWSSLNTCIFCDQPGFTPDPSITVDGVSCADWQRAATANSTNEDCVLLRATAVAKCGCPLVTSNDQNGGGGSGTGNGAVNAAGDIACQNDCFSSTNDQSVTAPRQGQDQSKKQLPNSELTCGEVMSFPAVDGQETCNVLLETYGYWCDCPNITSPCFLCENGLPPARPDAQFSASSDSCQTIANTLNIVQKQQCESYKKSLTSSSGYDIESFCGCGSTNTSTGSQPSSPTNGSSTTKYPLETKPIEISRASSGVFTGGENPNKVDCRSPCPDGSLFVEATSNETIVPDWNAACSEWIRRLPYVTNQTLCEDLQTNVIGPYCCDNTSSTVSSTKAKSGTVQIHYADHAIVLGISVGALIMYILSY